MLNWADLSVLLMILAGAFSGFWAAHAHKAGIMTVILFVVLGLLIGIGVGRVFNKLAYLVLKSKMWPSGVKLLLYMLIPYAGLFIVICVPVWLALVIYR